PLIPLIASNIDRTPTTAPPADMPSDSTLNDWLTAAASHGFCGFQSLIESWAWLRIWSIPPERLMNGMAPIFGIAVTSQPSLWAFTVLTSQSFGLVPFATSLPGSSAEAGKAATVPRTSAQATIVDDIRRARPVARRPAPAAVLAASFAMRAKGAAGRCLLQMVIGVAPRLFRSPMLRFEGMLPADDPERCAGDHIIALLMH